MTNRFITPEYDALKTQLDDINKKMKETAKTLFQKASKQLFEAVPALAEIRWLQYTPYFNDGDSCQFSVNDINFISKADLEEVDGEIDDLDDVDYGYNSFVDIVEYYKERYELNVQRYGEKELKEYSKAVSEFEDFIISIDNSIMESMFGDHVLVRITPEGIIVDEYEHD